MSKVVAIAGATGFVGKSLGARLGEDHRVIGLARNPPSRPEDGFSEWRKTDFLSLLDAERGLEGVEIAYYLIHSMMPSARLTQGRFQDFDLISADNFARSAKLNGVKQLIYLGGLIPEGEKLSAHLQSRLEVEQVLGAYGIPLTTLRASLIVGTGGSSFVIVQRLVERLPIMICPGWTQVKTQPISIEDTVGLLKFCAGNPKTYSKTFDIGGPDVLSYEEMMRETARAMSRKLRVVRFPFFTPGLSRLWVSLVTGAPRNLVRPLLQSLRHTMVARSRTLQEEAGIPGIPFRDFVRKTLQAGRNEKIVPVAFLGSRRGSPDLDVSSVQRFKLPKGITATECAKEYIGFLQRLFGFLLTVSVSADSSCRFYIWPFKKPLLVLSFSKERSTEDRALFYIRGGVLAKVQGRGRFELREILGSRFLLAAVLEFRPRLPWFIYRATQAKVHLWVMRRFGRHLNSIRKNETNS